MRGSGQPAHGSDRSTRGWSRFTRGWGRFTRGWGRFTHGWGRPARDSDGPARAAFALGIAGVLVAAACALVDLDTVLRLYVGAFVGWGLVPLGGLVLLMIAHLIGGAWRDELGRPLTALAWVVPVSGLAFVPILLGSASVYPWAAADGGTIVTGFKSVWLDPAFFAVRAVAYFIVATAFAIALARAGGTRPGVASVGLISMAIVLSLAGVDWAMSLEPDFYSSVYGLIFAMHVVLGGLGTAILLSMLADARPAESSSGAASGGSGIETPRHGESGAPLSGRRAVGLGAILLSAVLLWAYFHAMQFIVIWAGNLPDEIRWYLRRVAGAWVAVPWLLFVLQLVIPFFALLSARVRHSRRALAGLAGLTLLMRLVEGLWLVLPALDLRGAAPWLIGAAGLGATAAVAGLLGGAFLLAFRWTSTNAAARAEALAHG